ncbi:MAG: M3 family oligoendopeptidase [Spirochaetales bacterium]|nr:M3 family oligoendopeptidase [Spirochaetales bacterium]
MSGPDSTGAPRWSLESIYPALDSSEFETAIVRLTETISQSRSLIGDETRRRSDAAGWLQEVLSGLNRADDLFETLESYCYSSYSVDTGDEKATAALNRVGEIGVPLAELAAEFRNALATIDTTMEKLTGEDDELAGYRWILEEELFLQARQMSIAEEGVAADLNRSGADAWSRLQETISSGLEEVWDEGTGERKTVVQLRSLALDADRAVRRKAWEKERAAWKRVEIPLAFAINGVKGSSHTLNTRRGWKSTLERSTHQSRLSPKALDALIDTMRESLPTFRRYFHAKARALGLKRLSFYDLFAPVGESTTMWNFATAIEFIREQFASFDPEQAQFVADAADAAWIDAEPRSGKVGGAYCIDFPVAGESRILSNFNGAYDDVVTLAHELGHAWHSHQMRALPAAQRHYPMTLAETASIFSETLVFYSTVARSEGAEELYVIEQFLQGAGQVIVDILSRFDFERALMERRATGEVPARKLCEMMIDAQKGTYGNGLNAEELHPYMWAVKGHYYRQDLAFYNFPYAFGQLFGLGLYDRYEREPNGFAARYRTILRETGRRDAVAVTRSAGCDIESKAFWHSAMGRIAGLVDRFETLVDAT